MKPSKKAVKTAKQVSAKKAPKKPWVKPPSLPGAEEHLRRVRQMCMALPQTTEKLSHGAPTFFAEKRVYAMFVDNHHNDGHLSVWIPVPPDSQATLIKTQPQKFLMPSYVGCKGWVGVELDAMGDDELGFHLCEAWRLIAKKKIPPRNEF